MNDKVRPMAPWVSVLLFGIPCLLEILLLYRVMPWLDSRGVHPFFNYWVFYSPMFLIFFAAFAGHLLEGGTLRPDSWTTRFRLRRMNRGDAWWSLGLSAFFIASYVSMVPLANYLVEFTPNADVLETVLGDQAHFAGFELRGNWWLLVLFLTGYFFNVVGEELWWRGYILPRQVARHGRWAWVFHGTFWTLFHVFFLYDIALIFPGAMALSWVCQKRESTWPGIIAHGALNILAGIRIVKGILGP